MTDSLQQVAPSLMHSVEFWINVYALVISLITVLFSTKKLTHLWRTRHLRKVWGIRDGDYVIVVCSELNDPEERQNVEPREFIYSLKYGDVDAYFEVVVTILRLYPKIKLRIMSSGEAESSRIDLAKHLILIGGPDYNAIAGKFLTKKITQFNYLSPYLRRKSKLFPNEIVIHDTSKNKEYCTSSDEQDFGYFERIRNPNNPDNHITLIGGCHTIGVTGAVKAFSMAQSEEGEIPKSVLSNAKKVAKRISKKSEFSVLVSSERVGQTISTPLVEEKNITVRNK